ncbi:MAG: LysR family transcriptional regulator [Nannocystaceae bacterium]|nr:LysR family transcriptional regulator [bacterium]
MDWDDVRHFLALARTRSVRAAGASLGVSHSTVARRVEGLEARLQTRLFDRNRDGYLLTQAGRDMLPGAERVEQEIAQIERGLAGADARMRGVVSLTCCDAWVSSMLVPSLAALCDEHPGLEFALSTDARSFDLAKREADIALRVLGLSSSPPEALIGRPLVPVTVCSYVAAEHAERLCPRGGAARWLAFDDRSSIEMMVAGSSHPDVPLWGSFASLQTIVQAASAGLGWAMLPTYVGDAEPSLQRLDAPDLRHVANLWLLYHPDLRDNARVRAAKRCAEEAILAQAARFEGR